MSDPFEPKAQSLLNAIGDGSAPEGLTCADAYQVSIAISLKRIADVLDGTTLGLNVMETIFNPQTVQNRDVRNRY